MTYCVGVLLNDGIVLGSDSRTHAGVDDFASFCKMTVFERPGDRVLVLLSSGSLAGTQAVISVLKQARRHRRGAGQPDEGADDVRRGVHRLGRDARRSSTATSSILERNDLAFNASFILGGQISGEPMRLFRIYAEGNFIEAGAGTPFFQTGEAKYGKPIIDRVIDPSTSLSDAAKCVLVSFDSTMRSNLSVGMPIDLICYERDALEVRKRRRFEQGDPYFGALSKKWSEGVRAAFKELPDPQWGV